MNAQNNIFLKLNHPLVSSTVMVLIQEYFLDIFISHWLENVSKQILNLIQILNSDFKNSFN